MKKLLLLLLVAFCASFGYAQEVKMNIDIDSIDEIDFCESVLYNKYKPEYTSLPDSTKLILMIRYFTHFRYAKEWLHKTVIVTTKQIIKWKKGVCADFSELFYYIAGKYGIPAEIYIPYNNHCANLLIYNNEMYALDVTIWVRFNETDPPMDKPYELKKYLSRPMKPTFKVAEGGIEYIRKLNVLNNQLYGATDGGFTRYLNQQTSE